jgi:hypothetical protein
MDSIRRFSGNYDIYSNAVTIHGNFNVLGNTSITNTKLDIYSGSTTIHGNLVVLGNTSSVTTTNSTVGNLFITLNSGESGAGITQGNSGIIISRGTSANAVWQYSEISSRFEGLVGTSLSAIRAAAPVNADDVVTKGYLQSLPSAQPGGINTSVQYSNGTSIVGDTVLRYNSASGQLSVGNLQLTTNSIRNFTGPLQVGSPIQMPYSAQPASVSSKVTLYANVPGSGGTGVYFVNTSAQDELISKSKATVLALIFS